MTMIIGAGMAGLLAARMLGKQSEIWEAQERLPNNHSAVLRFRSPVVGDTLGIPFRKVKMMKCVAHSGINSNPVRDMMLYSHKISGTYAMRSLVGNEQVHERFIAPDNFVEQAAEGVDIFCSKRFTSMDARSFADSKVPVISTIPMPTLMDILEYDGPRPAFYSIPGRTVTADITTNCDVHCSIYCPEPDVPFYRVSITGRQLIVEYAEPPGVKHGVMANKLNRACDLIGLDGDYELVNFNIKTATYAKILDCDRELAKRFMIWATDKFGIYSLGRFATWRPGLLLDDCVNDVRQIQRMMKQQHNYELRKK